MCAARDLRLRVGADLAVVGFNDTPFAAELRQLLRRNAGPALSACAPSWSPAPPAAAVSVPPSGEATRRACTPQVTG